MTEQSDLDLDTEETEETETSDQQTETTFIELHERAVFAVGARYGREAAEGFALTYTRPADLLLPGSDEDIGRVRDVSPQTADALGQLRDEARAEQERARELEAQSTRETMKEALRGELADQAAADQKAADDERVRQDLLDEIARESAGDGDGPKSRTDAAYAIVEEGLEVVHSPDATWDQKDAAATKAIDALASLEVGTEQNPVTFDVDQFLAEVNVELERKE